MVAILYGMELEATSLHEVVAEQIWYLLRGMVFTLALGSTFTERGLQPCLLTRCNMVWKDVCPSQALSV